MNTGFLFAQNPYYISIDNTSGLPSNSIYDIFQDSKGFMWFASGEGLCQYDGNFTKTYTADFQTSKSGSCIQEDQYGRIWYENFDGFLYYVENDELKALKQSNPIGYYRYGITRKHLMILESDGVVFYDLKTLKPIRKIKIKFEYLQYVYGTSDKLYVLDDRLYEIDDDGSLNSYPYPKGFREELHAPIVQKTETGIAIISKLGNNYCYFENGKFIKNQFKFPVFFNQNLATTKNTLWLCTTEGLIQYNSKTHESKNYFTDKNISFIYLDRQNNYWISTLNEGVYFIENFNTKIIELPSKPTLLSRTKTDLLVGVERDALFKIDPNNYSYKRDYKGKLNHGVTQLFHDDPSGITYLTSSSFKQINGQKTKELKVGAVKSIAKIDEKYFAFAASSISGVFTINNQLNSSWDVVFDNYPSTTNDHFSKTNLVPYRNGKSTLFNPKNQTIYYATNNGLIAFSKKKEEEIKYNNKTIYLTSIAQYNGILYGFSSNSKIYTVSPSNQVDLYKFLNNRIPDQIEKIKIQDQFLFVFTSNDIYEINLDNNKIKRIITLTKDITISDVEILNSKYYFASSKGIIVKATTKDKTNPAPQLFINKITVNDERELLDDYTELSYTENNIKINFTVLSHIPNEKFKVLYSINNSKWNPLDAENRNLILSSLSPNGYNIKLKIDDKKITTIKFTIKKPFWLSSIFLLVMALLGILALYSIYKYKISNLKKKNKIEFDKINLEKNVNQSKLRAIKSQMNPHFFYNALNTLQSYILSNEKKQAVEYLSKFSNLTRTILEMTEKDLIAMSDEIITLKLYLDLEKARFEEDFDYKITSNCTSENEHIKIPTMLLQPYLENAIKHGLLHKKGKKELIINFEKTKDILKIIIDDNGIGRKKSAELNAIKNKNHISFATEATKNRIDLLNQYTHRVISVEIIDKTNLLEQSAGTTVIFTIPVSY